MSTAQKTIVVCGGGLAGNMVTMSLANSLGHHFDIVQISEGAAPKEDILYGSVTGPESYNFLRSIGLDEPTLLLKSNTSFSYGTYFRQWLSSSWMQCHHAPLPVLAGVPMRHHLTRSKISLEPLLISAQAAISGRFAHPSDAPNSPLSRAEYGYQFSTGQWVDLLDQLIASSRAQRLTSSIASVTARDGHIRTVTLDSGESVTGDLFIDATVSSRRCILAADGTFNADREVAVWLEKKPVEQLGPACRYIETSEHGWSTTTFLQNSEQKLTVTHPDIASDQKPFSRVWLGHMDQAWIGNCVAIGHASHVIEPLTPAPMMLLQRDIERLLELIPASDDSTTERREYNRRFRLDLAHTNMFQNALLSSGNMPGSLYWNDASRGHQSDDLERKISQFENRGVLVSYDLEPFNEEDWTIVHLGMGRQPRQYDRQLDRVPAQQVEQQLAQIKHMIEQMVSRMPPHHIYMTKLKQYIETQNHA